MKKSIAIIRGGEVDNIRSLKNGLSIIQALYKYLDELEVVDVSLDLGGNWFERGIPSSPHKVFSKVDYYLDLTYNPESPYHKLAKNLKVQPIFADNYTSNLGRINLKRILKQLQLETPKYTILRDEKNLKYSLKDIWNKFNTPLIIKEDSHKFNEASLLSHSFLETFNRSQKILQKGGAILLEEYCRGKYISIGIIPDFRNQEIYLTIPIETLNLDLLEENLNTKSLTDKYLISHHQQKRIFNFYNPEIKDKVFDLATKLYRSLALEQYTMIDFGLTEKGKEFQINILDIHTQPNIFEDSRFDYLLKSSGVNLGELVMARLNKLEKASN